MPQILKQIAAGNDNGYGGIDGWTPNGSVNGIGRNFLGNPLISALRYQTINIPAGSTITSAYLRLKADGNDGDTINFKIHGIDEDDAGDFASNPVSRSKTTASVSWSIAGVTNNSWYTSPDIKSVIQEIIDRAGWASGNDLALITDDDGSSNDKIIYFQAYSDGAANSPELEINYTDPVGVHSITKSLGYRVKTTPAAKTKLMRYSINDLETAQVAFSGIKFSKEGHNVLKTKDPDRLVFSTDYNTLKYFDTGIIGLNISEDPYTEYGQSTYVTHDLGYFPVVFAYVKDDIMSNYQPLGRFQAGSGAYRQFYYHITTTRIYFYAKGWSGTGAAIYTVYFYYQLFKNNLNL